MTSGSRCHRCGTRTAGAALDGLCPACLLSTALAPAPLTILTRLGAGPTSVAYLAEHPDDSGQLAVLKKMTPAAAGRDLAARVEALRQRSAALVHRHIARVLDLGLDEDGRPYALTEFWPGIPVSRFREHVRARSGGSHRADLARVREHAEAALACAHGLGIVHGAVGPSNLLVARTASGPALKVVDFGHAELVGRLSSSPAPADDWRALEALL